MFNLEKEIKKWGKNLRKNSAFEDGDIAELESHLRDNISTFISTGDSSEEAFIKAINEIGNTELLNREWDKTRFSSKIKQQKYMIKQSLQALIPSYFQTALRNLRKRFSYTFLNILGLSTGLATFILIFLFVSNEITYDKFHEDEDLIYRVVVGTSDDQTPTNANGPFGTGFLLKKDYSNQVAEFGRIRSATSNSKIYVTHGENAFYEESFHYADPGFLKLFNFPIIQGDVTSSLSRPNTILLTEETSKKYFAETNPIGKVITADPYQNGNLMDFEITGVLKDLPENTHLRFNFLASFSSQTEENINSHLNGLFPVYTYIKVSEGTDPQQLESNFETFLIQNFSDDPWYSLHLQPLTDIHLYSDLRSEISPNGSMTYVYIFIAIGLMILVIAGINFVNLTTARSSERAQEVGIRKSLGAQKIELVIQFLGEALIITFLSGLLAIGLVYLLLPVFNSLTQKSFEFIQLFSFSTVALYGLILTIIGILSGLYPALFISSFKAIDVLKGKITYLGGGGLLRKILVVSQFTVSAILIIATITIYQQLNFIQNESLGFPREEILTLPFNPEAKNQFEVLKSEWERNSNVISVSSSSHVPTSGTNHNGFFFPENQETVYMARIFIDDSFAETYDLKLLSGSDISVPVSDPNNAEFLINELGVGKAGFENNDDILEREVTWEQFTGKVKGVVNNIILYDFRSTPYPIMFFISPRQHHKFISIRINTAQTANALENLQEIWDTHINSYPFDYAFLDDKFEAQHIADKKMAEIIAYFSFLALMIGCLGLFGLSAYMAERKRKEIGVRKVLGASIAQVIGLLSKDFIKLIIVAIMISSPIAYWALNKWLQQFVFKISINPFVFFIAAFLLLMVTFTTILYQSLKSARMNPAKSLKSD